MARKFSVKCDHCSDYQTPAFDNEADALKAIKAHEKDECVNRIRSETRVIGAPRNDSTDIRQWARANGFSVGERGRIHADIHEAFARANGGAVDPFVGGVKIADRPTDTVVLSQAWRTNFCTKCKPGEPNKMHVYCKGTIQNATIDPAGARAHVRCTCPCHEEETAA